MQQSVHGLIILNKPKAISSNSAIQQIKKQFQLKKVGHTGTLDPLATGVLPVSIGEATKFSQQLLNSNKEYLATVQLGLETDSHDLSGKVLNNYKIEQKLSTLTIRKLLETDFTGSILQTPPLFSALKHQGKPLYKYARLGNVSVKKPPRLITIYDIELISYDSNNQLLTFKTLVSKGSYIRVLGHDISKKICGYGGSLTQLCRTKVGSLTLQQSYNLEQILQTTNISSILHPITSLLSSDKIYHLKATEFAKISVGNSIIIDKSSLINFNHQNEQAISTVIEIPLFFKQNFIGIGYYQDYKIWVKRLINSQLLFELNQ